MGESENVGESAWKIHISARYKKKFRLCVRVTVPSLLIIGVWSLLSLPIVFNNLPISEISSNTSGANTSDSDSMCSAPLQYSTASGICLTELTDILISSNCTLDAEGGVLVVKNEESTITQVINIFKYIGASDECIRKGISLLCLHLFGLCEASGISIQPTTSQCEEIRDMLCQKQWVLVQRFGIGLPDCSMFPAEASSCPALNNSLSTSIPVMRNLSDRVEKHPNGTTLTVLECTEGFYQENGSSICTPSCYTWMKNTQAVSIFGDVMIILCTLFAFLVNVAIVIISCLGHRRMLVYPAIFIVYMTIDSMVIVGIGMVGYMGRDRLFCSSRSLIQSTIEVTPFCVISGVLVTYTFFQTSLWWLFHITTLFWQVIFPFHALTFENTGKNKYIHIMCITLGILLPVVPIITIMADFAVDLQKQSKNSNYHLGNRSFLSGGLGFEPRTYPAYVCIGSDSETNLYSVTLVANFISGLGCFLLIIIFSSLHKAHIKRKQMQNVNTGKPGYQFRFGKAEKKLFILLCYYVVLCIIYPLPFFLSARNFEQYFDSLQKHFICEQGGHNPSRPCSLSDVETYGEKFIGVLANIMFTLFPVMNLLYTVNVQELKKLKSKVHCPCIIH